MSTTHICRQCRTPITPATLDKYENVDGHMYHCSVCDNYLFTKPFPKQKDFSLTADEIRYTIHCLEKQMVKLDNAQRQLNTALAKLEIMLETTKEAKNVR